MAWLINIDLLSCFFVIPGSTFPQCISQTTHIRHKRTTGKYAKSTLNNDGLVANVFSAFEGNEGQRGVGFIPLAFALQGEPLMVK